ATAPPELQSVENRPEQPLQVGEGDHAMRPAEPVVELLVHNAIGEEIDEGVGLRIDVVAVEQDLGVVEYLAQTPDERLHGAHQVRVRAQRVQVDAVGLEESVLVYTRERLLTYVESV